MIRLQSMNSMRFKPVYIFRFVEVVAQVFVDEMTGPFLRGRRIIPAIITTVLFVPTPVVDVVGNVAVVGIVVDQSIVDAVNFVLECSFECACRRTRRNVVTPRSVNDRSEGSRPKERLSLEINIVDGVLAAAVFVALVVASTGVASTATSALATAGAVAVTEHLVG